MERRVGVVGATAIGAGSMLGAGVFVVWGPAAEAAGGLLVWAVLLAGVVAALNAGSTAQLAAVHPVAGGAYSFGRAELGPWPGFVAGIGFVVGKTASIAAIALAVGGYLVPDHAPAVATAAVVASWLLNSRGITRTAAASVVIASLVIGVLVAALFAATGAEGSATATFGWSTAWDEARGLAQAAALVFFAFAGYARIATLGEEVREPSRTIPRAIGLALGIAAALYVALAVVLPRALGADLADATAPVADAVDGTWLPGAVVTAAAVAAAAGSLLALTAGVGRTAMAMAREGDLPRALARLNAREVPALAEGAACLAAIVLVWAGGLPFAIAMSSFAVLLYYAVANAAAHRAAGAGHVAGWRMPRALSALGLVACVALMASLPLAAVGAAAALLGVLMLGRIVARR
ncbi:APC family permease [Demequina mangrovi]|uniref:Amino acid/polyamine/organocation transporter, APC superfamily n=1 Tax=Demequina mangrovi TaxID=1043493 RepID=A0A1H6X5E9_9MICO|nr:APC family permease [Demequina mangrovi]SEJ20072.1 amino acid/polyamine/organocation transporter, APC superfamily [Demequina mangrovi]